jgi:hypothetical protein
MHFYVTYYFIVIYSLLVESFLAIYTGQLVGLLVVMEINAVFVLEGKVMRSGGDLSALQCTDS